MLGEWGIRLLHAGVSLTLCYPREVVMAGGYLFQL